MNGQFDPYALLDHPDLARAPGVHNGLRTEPCLCTSDDSGSAHDSQHPGEYQNDYGDWETCGWCDGQAFRYADCTRCGGSGFEQADDLVSLLLNRLAAKYEVPFGFNRNPTAREVAQLVAAHRPELVPPHTCPNDRHCIACWATPDQGVSQ